MLEKLKSFKWGYLLLALTLVTVGVLFIIFGDALNYLAIAIGIVQLVFGIVYVALTISKRDRGVSFYFNIIFASTAVISGATTLIARESSIDIIASLIALILIVDSGFKLHTAAMSRRYNVVGWWLILAFSAIVAAGGYWMLKFTPETIAAESVLLGITLIVDGASNLCTAFYLSAYEKAEENRIYLKAKRDLVGDDDEAGEQTVEEIEPQTQDDEEEIEKADATAEKKDEKTNLEAAPDCQDTSSNEESTDK